MVDQREMKRGRGRPRKFVQPVPTNESELSQLSDARLHDTDVRTSEHFQESNAWAAEVQSRTEKHLDEYDKLEMSRGRELGKLTSVHFLAQYPNRPEREFHQVDIPSYATVAFLGRFLKEFFKGFKIKSIVFDEHDLTIGKHKTLDDYGITPHSLLMVVSS